MEKISLQQIKSLELILDYQQIKIDLYLYHLKQLAKIESNLITFGSLSNEIGIITSKEFTLYSDNYKYIYKRFFYLL